MSELPDFATPPSRGNNGEGKQTAEQQASNVPLGWKPTFQKPLPSVKCTATKRDGNPCGAWSLAGATVCLKHGGHLPNVKTAIEERKAAARLLLIDASGDAAETIEYLARFATQENVRLAAAKEVLDRAGIKGGADMTIDVQHSLAPSKMLDEKIAQMANRLNKDRAEQFTTSTKLDIIESEVVPEEKTEESTNE